MVCSYCQTRNIPTAAVCAHCGVILRLTNNDARVPKNKVSRSAVLRAVFIGVAALIGAAGGIFLVAEDFHKVQRLYAGVIGAVTGGMLLYLVTGARVLYLTNKYRSRLRSLQGRMRHALSRAEEKYEKELEDKAGTYDPRLHLAIAHLLQDEIEKSVQEFQQAQKLGASKPVFFNNAGVAMARRGNLNQSVELFQKAAVLNGHQAHPHVNLAHAYLHAVADEEKLLIDHALDEIKQSVSVDGEKPVHLNSKGLIQVRAKRNDEAIATFKSAIELAASSNMSGDEIKLSQADSNNNIGLALFNEGDVRGAVLQFQTAVRIDPGHGRALSNLGVMQLLQGDHTEALITMRNAARLDPRSAPVRNNLGYALCRTRTVNDGLREFREAVLLDPGFFEPYYNLGKVYLDEKVLEVAERNLTRAYQINPNSWELMAAIGVMRMDQEQWPQAIQLLEKADKLAPEQPLILTNLATCIALDGDYIRAQDILQKAVEYDELNSAVHNQLGWVYLLQENVSMCGNEMSAAIHLNPNIALYHNNYGLCLIGRGDYDNALSSFRKSLSLDPEYGKVHYHIGYVYALQGKLDQAIKEWENTQRLEAGFIDCLVNLGVAYYQSNKFDMAVTEFKRVIAARQHLMEDFSNLGLALAKQGVAIRKGARNREDPKWKESVEKHKLAVDMFDRALTLEPKNVMLHSNRGLACYFANRAEDAVMEWGMVSKLDPGYARRREKTMQSEFDESAIKFAQLEILHRADRVAPATADFVYQLSPGYDTEEWSVIIDDDDLINVPDWSQRSRHFERRLKALRIE